MSSSGPSKKSGGSGGQSKSKKSATAESTNNAAQPEFLVKKITGKRFWNGRPQLQVEWQGYKESTWEPMENLGNCVVLLADFEAEIFRLTEQKKKLGRLLARNRSKNVNKQATSTAKQPKDLTHKAPAPVKGRVEIGKPTGPKAHCPSNRVF